MGKYRIVHYINQFFAGLGGEEKADTPPQKQDGFVGPGQGLSAAIGDNAEIVGTIICGDSYFNENEAAASKAVLEMIESYKPDLVVVGPAFNAGRYGMACGLVAKIVDENLNIPVVGGIYVENPGFELYKPHAFFVETTNAATGMRQAVPAMAELIKKFVAGEPVKDGQGYMPRNYRQNHFEEKRGARRAVDMLLKKIAGEEFVTEYPMPKFDRVAPGAAIKDIKTAKIAFVSSGGPVPKGNPDRIESSSASKYGKYSLADITDLTEANGETAHGGYDPVYANEDLDRVLPVDALKELLKEGEIGSIHEYWYSTVGNGTSVGNSRAFGGSIAEQLLADGVDGVILTST